MLRLNSLSIAIASSLGGKTFGVTLSSVTGGLPASGTGIVTINMVPAPDIIVPVINASRTTGVAPLAITFDALATTAPLLTALPFSEIHYEWRFGDDRGTFWSYGANAGGNNKNIAFGPVAAHVFETSGTFTVELIASQINNAGQLIQTTTTLPNIVVTNADTVFADAATICISQNSLPVQGVNGVPATAAVQQVADWSTVATLAQTYKRILLKRGDTWSVTTGVALDQVSRTGEGIIGAYGTGAKPILELNYDGTIITTDADVSDWRFMDLSMTANGTGPRPNSRSVYLVGSTDLLVLRCDTTGALYDAHVADADGVYIVDSILGPVEPYAGSAVGYCLYESKTTRMHMMGTRAYGNTTHGVRLQGATLSSFDCNTVNDSAAGTPGNVFTLRGWSPYTGTEWTENVVITRNVFTGNANNLAVFGCHPQFNTSEERIRRVIADGNFVSGVTSLGFFSVATEFTVRNNLFVTSNNTNVEMRGESSVGSPFPTQSFFYNNTLYSTASGSSHTAFLLTGTISGMVLTNNIAYAPNATTTFLTDGTGAEVTTANNSSDSQIKNDRPWAAVTPVDAVDYTPSGSYAVDGGTWVPVYKNYFGTTNSAPREIGAI